MAKQGEEKDQVSQVPKGRLLDLLEREKYEVAIKRAYRGSRPVTLVAARTDRRRGLRASIHAAVAYALRQEFQA